MRKDTTLIILGFFIAVIPLLGIPSSWKMVTTVILGIAVALISLSLRHYLTRVSERLRTKKTQSPVYVESVAPDSEKSHEVPSAQPTSTRRRIRQTV